jgi:hypothetical protein
MSYSRTVVPAALHIQFANAPLRAARQCRVHLQKPIGSGPARACLLILLIAEVHARLQRADSHWCRDEYAGRPAGALLVIFYSQRIAPSPCGVMDEAGRGGGSKQKRRLSCRHEDRWNLCCVKSANALSPGKAGILMPARCWLVVEPHNSLLQRGLHSCGGPRCGPLSYCFKII